VALAQAIRGVRERGGIAIVVAHRPSALTNLDQILVMAGGTVQAFGRKAEVLSQVLRAADTPQSIPTEAEALRRQRTVVPLHEKR
ncbi:MAG: type I secretion system permease/ATPase, partial [Mesorhizobium sp.]